ncbi:MAG TPA: Ku protein [Solirubrobacteraceae bacterium]|jgi:DNA end-binding protein Ku|nr:Ku protein [Solirubrobacteraceae bacterium]
MPRALWSGSLSFGLVNVPVQIVSATRDLDYHFHQLHEKDKARIEQRRYCSKEDSEIGWEEVGHGYELRGKQVVLSDEELASVQPRKTRTIDIDEFVDLTDVDPIYFEHSYYLVPAGDSEGTLRAYRLLVEVMAGQERAALGRFVMRTKEYLAAVRAREGALTLTTMRFHDEVRPSKDVGTGGKKPSKRQLEVAVAIVNELSTDWQPDRYEDCYRTRLRAVIDAKRKRRTIEVPPQEKEPLPVPDLMAALQESIEALKRGEDPRATARTGAGRPGRTRTASDGSARRKPSRAKKTRR